MDPNTNSNQYGQYNNYQSGYQSANQGGGSFLDRIRYAKRLNGLEIITIVISIILLVSVFVFGFINGQQSSEDAQRSSHMQQVSSALTEYYNNSSAVPSQRTYPIALCSADANEVDFELTLRLALTGKILEKDTHAYIQPNNYPKDINGVYSKSLSRRTVAYRCPNILPTTVTADPNTNIYSDGWDSCNFSRTRNPKCYLYASSNNGDTFTIGYFSQINNRFILFTKFRDQDVVRSLL